MTSITFNSLQDDIDLLFRRVSAISSTSADGFFEELSSTVIRLLAPKTELKAFQLSANVFNSNAANLYFNNLGINFMRFNSSNQILFYKDIIPNDNLVDFGSNLNRFGTGYFTLLTSDKYSADDDGTVTSPAFNVNTNSGIYYNTDLRFALDGVNKFTVKDGGISLENPDGEYRIIEFINSSNPDGRTFINCGTSGVLSFTVRDEQVLILHYNYIVLRKRFRPSVDNLYDIGEASFRYDDIYASNGVIQTSDENQKKNIEDSRLGIDFVNKLLPKSYKFKGGKSGRTHYGLLAQDVKKLLDDENISTNDFAGFIYNEAKREYNADTEQYENYGEQYGLRYTEFIPILIQSIKDLSQENNRLRNKLNQHETSIQDIYERLINLETENKRIRK
jgi:hypothetical protein